MDRDGSTTGCPGRCPRGAEHLAQLLTSATSASPALASPGWHRRTAERQRVCQPAVLLLLTAPGPALAMKCGFHCIPLDGREAPKAAELPWRRKRSLPRQCGTNLQGWIMSCSRKGIRAATGSTESSSGSCSPAWAPRACSRHIKGAGTLQWLCFIFGRSTD